MIVQVEPGVFLAVEDGRVREIRVDGDTVTIDGRRYQNAGVDPRKWNAAGSSGQTQGKLTIKAPMPGKVVRVLVNIGDTVEPGQGIVVVEAMKMQNELKTLRAGTVTEVHAKENDTVEANSLLAVIE